MQNFLNWLFFMKTNFKYLNLPDFYSQHMTASQFLAGAKYGSQTVITPLCYSGKTNSKFKEISTMHI